MSYKKKLIELLKSVDEIREDLESNEFLREQVSNSDIYTYRDDIIILSEHHLRMYCEDIAIGIEIRGDGQIQDYQGIYMGKLDNTKSFDNQSDKVYEDIYIFLTKE